MNTKDVKLALLKINSDCYKSPRNINNFHTPKITKKNSTLHKKIELRASNTNNSNLNKHNQSNNILINQIMLSNRSESRNNQISSKRSNGKSSCQLKDNIKSNSNYISMISSPNQINDMLNLSKNFKNNKSAGTLSLPKFKKLNIISNITQNYPTKKQRAKTPKTEEYFGSRLDDNSKVKIPEQIDVMTLLNHQNYVPLSLSNLHQNFPNFESSKSCSTQIKFVKGYAANTNQGIIRNYNEDRVTIIINISKPETYTSDYWPKCSYFAIYDGHGGSLCADFLRDNLHDYIIKDNLFPQNPEEAIKNGFLNAENDFIYNLALKKDLTISDKSGSCAVVTLLIDDTIYIANLGDSRAIMSKNRGENVLAITTDHKPSELNEQKRINQAGGRVYQTQVPHNTISNLNLDLIHKNKILLGPFRIYPGRLSVSRSFGDVEAKLLKFGGTPGVLIANPDIYTLKITNDIDFIVMACDGIFDQISNNEAVESVWISSKQNDTFEKHCSMAVDMIMKSSLSRKSMDNVTVIFLAFENFEKAVTKKQLRYYTKRSSIENLEVINNGINISSANKLILQDTYYDKQSEIIYGNNKDKVEENLKLNNKISENEKNDIIMKNVKIAISRNLKNLQKSFSKYSYNNLNKFTSMELNKNIYVDSNQIEKKNQKIKKSNTFKNDKKNINSENIKFTKHVTVDIIPTSKARNVKSITDYFLSQNPYYLKSSNIELNKNRIIQQKNHERPYFKIN